MRAQRETNPIRNTNPDTPRYLPSRDNPQDNVRSGADDHKRYRSTTDRIGVPYRDRGHA